MALDLTPYTLRLRHMLAAKHLECNFNTAPELLVYKMPMPNQPWIHISPFLEPPTKEAVLELLQFDKNNKYHTLIMFAANLLPPIGSVGAVSDAFSAMNQLFFGHIYTFQLATDTASRVRPLSIGSYHFEPLDRSQMKIRSVMYQACDIDNLTTATIDISWDGYGLRGSWNVSTLGDGPWWKDQTYQQSAQRSGNPFWQPGNSGPAPGGFRTAPDNWEEVQRIVREAEARRRQERDDTARRARETHQASTPGSVPPRDRYYYGTSHADSMPPSSSVPVEPPDTSERRWKFTDPYKVIGIGERATEAEVKAAHRKLVIEYHPDKHPGEAEKYTVIIQAINGAYDKIKLMNGWTKKRR